VLLLYNYVIGLLYYQLRSVSYGVINEHDDHAVVNVKFRQIGQILNPKTHQEKAPSGMSSTWQQ